MGVKKGQFFLKSRIIKGNITKIKIRFLPDQDWGRILWMSEPTGRHLDLCCSSPIESHRLQIREKKRRIEEMKRTCKSTEIYLKEEEDRIYNINFLTRPIFAVLRPPFAIILSLSLSLSLCLSFPLSMYFSLSALYHLSLPLSLSLSYIAMSFNSLFLSVPYIYILLFVNQNGSRWHSNFIYKRRKYIHFSSHLFFEGRLIVPPLYEVLISILLIEN